MRNLYIKSLGSILLATFLLTGCDQKPAPEQLDCTKPVSKMTDIEKNKCGKGGEYTKSPEKKW